MGFLFLPMDRYGENHADRFGKRPIWAATQTLGPKLLRAAMSGVLSGDESFRDTS